MKKTSFWGLLDKDNKFIVGNLFFMYLVQGIFTIMIGAILPMMKKEYGLSYEEGGWLISAHSVGNIVTGLLAGFLPIYLGMKNSLMALNVFAFVGFGITLFTGNPFLLVIALFFTGVGRGAVSNYNNLTINRLSAGAAGPLNMLHGFFAIGAFLSPFLVLFCTKSSQAGWRYTVIIVIALGIVSIITCPFMKMENTRTAKGDSSGLSMKFLKEKLFWITAGVMIFYLAIESTVMGWITTYFIDSGVMASGSAQLLNSTLWLIILIGRFTCIALSSRFATQTMILIMSIGIGGFFVLLVLSHTIIPMVIATLGLGLCMAGMYGTTVGNAGSILKDFPISIGIFTTLTGIGSIVMPTIIGAIAQNSGIRAGMSTVLGAVALLIIFSVWNFVSRTKLIHNWENRKKILAE